MYRWLIAHDYEDEAFKILADLENKSEDDPFIMAQHKEIVYTVQYERDQAGTKTIRRLILGAGTQAMQQLSGVSLSTFHPLFPHCSWPPQAIGGSDSVLTILQINVTSYYLPTVLIKSVGLGERMARLLAACNSVSYLLFSLIGIPNVERWGRRYMMIFAAAGQSFCYLIITILIRYSEKPGYQRTHEVASASVAFFFLYYCFFGIGMQGVPWRELTRVRLNTFSAD
jgi:hypothetical protein